MRTTNVEAEYLAWLYSKIGAKSDPNPAHSHWLLVEQMHRKRYLWFVANDDSRAADGLALRDEFMDHYGRFGVPPIDGPCSFLEMLIALARRAAFEAWEFGHPEETYNWFWTMVANIGLYEYTDDYMMEGGPVYDEIDIALDTVIERRYDRRGRGGLFPLKRSREDQRKVELWYQLSAYILENSNIGS